MKHENETSKAGVLRPGTFHEKSPKAPSSSSLDADSDIYLFPGDLGIKCRIKMDRCLLLFLPVTGHSLFPGFIVRRIPDLPYSNHIGGAIYINGELSNIDDWEEIEQAGIPIQPSLCTKSWNM